jgi:putative ABC transport system permease protein
VLLGLCLGTVLAVLVGRLLGSFLFDVRPTDPLSMGGVALLLGAVALLACAVPAWRATRIDPMEALRDE